MQGPHNRRQVLLHPFDLHLDGVDVLRREEEDGAGGADRDLNRANYTEGERLERGSALNRVNILKEKEE